MIHTSEKKIAQFTLSYFRIDIR